MCRPAYAIDSAEWRHGIAAIAISMLLNRYRPINNQELAELAIDAHTGSGSSSTGKGAKAWG